MTVTKVYEEVVDFIAVGSSPADVVAFQPSAEVRTRVSTLVVLEKTSGLSAEETAELEHYLQIEYLMRLAKARARQFCTGDKSYGTNFDHTR